MDDIVDCNTCGEMVFESKSSPCVDSSHICDRCLKIAIEENVLGDEDEKHSTR